MVFHLWLVESTSGQKRKAAPPAMRTLTLGRHSSSSPPYKHVMTSQKLPRNLRRILFEAPVEALPQPQHRRSPPQAFLLPGLGRELRGVGSAGLPCPPGVSFVPGGLVSAWKTGLLPWAACSASFQEQVGELCDKSEGESAPEDPE